jgi:hypothetical protein
MRSFSLGWRSDEVIMLLLSAIALFSPDRVNLIHQSGNRDFTTLNQVSQRDPELIG